MKLIVFVILLTAKSVMAQPYTEYELKAAYLFNFGKYAQWTEQSFDKYPNEFRIGVYGKNPFSNILEESVKGKLLNGKTVKVVYCKDIDEIKTCQIVFFSQVPTNQLKKVMDAVNNYPVLTIGDNIDGFCQSGGMINFMPQNARYRFEINNIEALKVKIIISSKLLTLAKIYKEDENKF